jgi:hypothetical protein
MLLDCARGCWEGSNWIARGDAGCREELNGTAPEDAGQGYASSTIVLNQRMHASSEDVTRPTFDNFARLEDRCEFG